MKAFQDLKSTLGLYNSSRMMSLLEVMKTVLTAVCVISERHLAATRKTSSEMYLALVSTAANPIAGKIYALLACTITSDI